MPIYEYACTCGHISEHRVSVEQRREPQPCEACGKPAARKLSYLVGHKMSREALLNHPKLANDGVHRLGSRKGRKTYGISA